MSDAQPMKYNHKQDDGSYLSTWRYKNPAVGIKENVSRRARIVLPTDTALLELAYVELVKIKAKTYFDAIAANGGGAGAVEATLDTPVLLDPNIDEELVYKLDPTRRPASEREAFAMPNDKAGQVLGILVKICEKGSEFEGVKVGNSRKAYDAIAANLDGAREFAKAAIKKLKV